MGLDHLCRTLSGCVAQNRVLMAQIYRVRAIGSTGTSGPCYFNAYYASGDATAEAAKSAVGNFFNESKALWTGVWTVQGDVALIDTVTDNILSVTALSPDSINGTKAGERLPSMLQMLMQYRTGVYRNGREVRGRAFLPGWAETDSDSGKPNTALVSAMVGFANTWLKDGDGDTQQVIYSRGQATAPAVTTINIWDEWAVLRSRRQ